VKWKFLITPFLLHDDLKKAGENFLLSVYPGGSKGSLDDNRFQEYAKLVTKTLSNKRIDLTSIPPTFSAVQQHSF